ncbi:hypothetical protein, partial [Xanthomonas campestris]
MRGLSRPCLDRLQLPPERARAERFVAVLGALGEAIQECGCSVPPALAGGEKQEVVAPEKPPITQRPQGLDVCSGVPELP